MKKTLSILLTLALLLGMGAVGASALDLPKPKIEFSASAKALALPKLPKLETPAFSAPFFAARALTEEEMDDVIDQLEELFYEAYMAAMFEELRLAYTMPALLLLDLLDPALYLKDGVSQGDLVQAYYDALEEILATYNVGMSIDELIENVIKELFGLDVLPYYGELGFEELMELIKDALADGSLQAAIDEAMQAYLAELQAAYAFWNDALAPLMKPEVLAFAEAFGELVWMYQDFYYSLLMLDFDNMTDEELAALEAIYFAIGDIMEGNALHTIDALLTEGKFAEATALTSEIAAVIAGILDTGVIPPTVSCKLTYDLQGGAGGPSAPVVTGIAKYAYVTLSATAPTKAGYTFKGWAAAAGGTEAIAKIVMNGDKTVYAIWEKIPVVKSAFEQWKDKLADGKFGGIFKGLANWANWLLYIIFYGLFGWLMNLIIK